MPAVDLNAIRSGQGPSLVVAHGLFGSARNWTSVARRLAERHTVHALDMRNHGASPWTDEMTYPAMAEDLLRYVGMHGLARPAAIGHSMGGKAAMTAALLAPERIGRLVVVDIAPVRYRHGFSALADALAGLDLDGVDRRTDADERLADAVPDAALRGFLLQNLVLRDGRYAWRLNLAAIAAARDTLWDFPDLLPSAAFRGPTLLIGGGASDYVRPDHMPVVERYFPNAEYLRIPGAGHWVHAERPDAFLAAVADFLGRTGRG
ncbi:MAG: alpha/beta fold hydrolase [Defluviicoccus sp.]|nr:alpha/beta fold hydrolase [Defluviicoccus sp.]MDE0278116.1 alpha/beta fold hydrolase [Defluviicoccus sp.]